MLTGFCSEGIPLTQTWLAPHTGSHSMDGVAVFQVLPEANLTLESPNVALPN